MTSITQSRARRSPAPPGLRRGQLGWLAAAVFVVSAGYGALMPLLPGWLESLMPADGKSEVARHVGVLSGTYTVGVLVGALAWGTASDRLGHGRILMCGLVGYVLSLLPLLRVDWTGLAGIYAARGASGFFVAAVIPVVPALVAERTPAEQRGRRFAWLGAMSLLGFLFGPGLNGIADILARASQAIGAGVYARIDVVILLSALLGAVTMLGLAASLPSAAAPAPEGGDDAATPDGESRRLALWTLNAAVMFVLAGFELGIVLQGQQHPALSAGDISLMFAQCSLVMLGVNAVLFFTGLLERTAGRNLLVAGTVLAIAGLAVLAQHPDDAWMYVGVSLTAGGTGLVLPTISFLAAGAPRRTLGATMGGLAAAAALGQTLGSAGGGWLFGAVAQLSFAWLELPLVAMLAVLIARPGGQWSTEDTVPAPAHAFFHPRPSRPHQEP